MFSSESNIGAWCVIEKAIYLKETVYNSDGGVFADEKVTPVNELNIKCYANSISAEVLELKGSCCHTGSREIFCFPSLFRKSIQVQSYINKANS